MMKNLIFRTPSSDDLGFKNQLDELRARIDSIDHQIIELVATRMNISGKMGEYKCRENVTVFQLDRWLEILQSRVEHGVHAGLEKDFIEHLIKVIHEESIRCQDKVMDKLRMSGHCPGAPDCIKNQGDKDI
jgi:chorismate mutase